MKSRISLVPRKESRRFISLGFGVILSLSIIVSIFSYSQLTVLKIKIDIIATEHHVKTSLINQMHKIVSERSLAVHNILNIGTKDPFRADEEFMHYNNLATTFVATRQLFQNFQLTEEEQKLFDEAMQIIRESQPLQDNIVTNALDGLSGSDTQSLLNQDWQNEQLLYDKFNGLLGIGNELNQRAYDISSNAYNSALKLLAILSFLTIFIGLITASYVVRRVTISEKALFEEKAQSEFTLQAMGDAVITADNHGKILYLNPIAESILGRSFTQLQGKGLSSIIQIFDKNNDTIKFDLENRRSLPMLSFSGATLYNKKTLQDYPIEGSTSLMHDESGKVIGTVNVIRDLSENKNLTDLIEWQATHDTLTGLINRSQFEHLLNRILVDVEIKKLEHAVLYLDINQFTVINDTCGHAAGDQLLKRITGLIQSRVRERDVVSRMGGNEFGILLKHCSINQAQEIAEVILGNIQHLKFKWEGIQYKIGVSIGVESINAHSINVAKIMSNVIAACIIAKEKGRNSLWVHRAIDTEVANRRGEMLLTAKISQALEKHNFTIYKQKILSVGESTDSNLFELLIRMNDEQGNQVLPVDFIPAAERYAIMPDIDKWVVSTVFSMIAEKKVNFPGSEIACINLSGQTLSQNSLLDFIEGEIVRTNIDPYKICFEITETSAVENLTNVTNLISCLRDKGCKFALDDFGSGMSSFAYLRNFNVDYIKIDGSFVRNIVTDNVDREMVKVMNNLGRVMKIKTIAEYVESDEILEELEKIGVDFVQGYSIHLPEPI